MTEHRPLGHRAWNAPTGAVPSILDVVMLARDVTARMQVSRLVVERALDAGAAAGRVAGERGAWPGSCAPG